MKKIRAKHSQYEAQRKLKAEHDIFLADDRIVIALPKLLGKTFYKGTKRPIPISISAPVPKSEGKRIERAKREGKQDAAGAKEIAREVEKALGATVVYLSPSTCTAVKVGYSGWDAAKVAENVEAVTKVLVEKYVPKGWRGVKALHVKGERTAALPIWLADELWSEEGDVITEERALEIERSNGKKRKSLAGAEEEVVGEKKAKKQKVLVESNDDKLDQEIALRKEKLKKQKEEAAKDVVDEVPKPSKKSKKAKAVAA